MSGNPKLKEKAIRIGPGNEELTLLCFNKDFIVPLEPDGRTIVRFADGRVLTYDSNENGFYIPYVVAKNAMQWDNFVSEWRDQIARWAGSMEAVAVLGDLVPLFYGKRVFTHSRERIQDPRIDTLILNCVVEELLTGTASLTDALGIDHPGDLYIQKLVTSLVELSKLEQNAKNP